MQNKQNTEAICELHRMLEDLMKHIAMLEENIPALMQTIEAGEFIPDPVNENVRAALNQISAVQSGFAERFISLKAGEMPLKIEDAYSILENCRKKAEYTGKYFDAVSFFLSLRADDPSVQQILEERQRTLDVLDFEQMSEQEIKDTAECYVRLSEAFHESDDGIRFSLLYSSGLEAEVARGVMFGLLKTETAQTKEAAEIKEPAEQGKEIQVNETTEKELAEICKSEIWKTIGIERPQEMIVKEERELLDVQQSARASDKFRVKDFRKDMTGEFPLGKIECLVEALENCGYSSESFALWKNKESSYYDAVSEKLFQMGYLKKYAVSGFSEFYTLSPKGEKAFVLRDSQQMIQKCYKKKINPARGGEHIEDSTNAAVARILYQQAFSRILKIDRDYTFSTIERRIGTNYFLIDFTNVLGGRRVRYLGIVSDNPEQFRQFHALIKETYEAADLYVVAGAAHEAACFAAKWISSLTGGLAPVWYCGYADEEVYDVITEEPADIVFERLEEAENEKQEEKSIADLANEKQEEKETADLGNEKQEEKETADSGNEKQEEKKTADRKEFQRKGIQENEAPDKKELQEEGGLEEASIKEAESAHSPANRLTEAEKTKHDTVFQEMLASGKFYAATAYAAVLSKEFPCYGPVYHQLAYALNDPMDRCSYSSDTIIHIFYTGENQLTDHYVVAAAVRNYFLDQYSYDYSLQQLQAMLSGNQILQQEPALNKILYTLQQFKTNYHSGIDRYADYREKERASWELHLEKTRREAKDFYDNYSSGGLKENASHRRFMETEKLLLGPDSDLSVYLKVVIDDEREVAELLEEFLAENYVKDQAAVCEENIDPSKIDRILDTHWDQAAQNMRLVKKSSDLMSSLRMNLFKKVNKIVSVLCNYVFLMHTAITRDDDPALLEYKKLRTPLLKDIRDVVRKFAEHHAQELSEIAGRAVLTRTLQEMGERLEGDYQEGNNKYFYINFLKDDKIILDDDFIPVLDEVLELPDFSVKNRLIQHCQSQEKDWRTRLAEIFKGGDDYGSAELILKYLKVQNWIPDRMELEAYSIEKAIEYPQKDMEQKRMGFIADLELAQSYGQIDNTKENSKEIMVQIMEHWYLWAKETKNYGFFSKILEAFQDKIHKDAQARAVELRASLNVYLKENPDWNIDDRVSSAVVQIRERIEQQNYAAAEDLLNRLIANDLDSAVTLQQEDDLLQFLDEYDVNYKMTANSARNLRSLVFTSRINKDTKGADRLLENWPKGAGAGKYKISALLQALGFDPDTVEADQPVQGKIENYLVTLKRPQNGRKINYKHPISAFGSEAETKGFRVVCIFGKADAQRLIDTFRELGSAKNTIVLLDYALTLADRRTLARKTKTDLNDIGRIFAVIDRVVLIYLAKHYTETAVNRMLMAVVMPFASYQPYIDKSAAVMPQEIFIGRKNELEKIESPTGVNIVYGGRQLGKTALLRMAKKDIDRNENGDRAVIVNAWRKDYRDTAKIVSAALYDEKILLKENITEDWNELARDIQNRLRDETDPIPYLLLMIDEADLFIESCEAVGYEPFNTLKDIQSIGSGRFKFVVAGLRNIVRFKRMVALEDNGVLPHLESLTVKPFKSMEARELLEVPLSYLGFRFSKNNETEVLISTIFGTTNYFPGLIQLYCTKLIEAMKKDYAGYSESETPPYYVQKEHIKKVLADQTLQKDIREKFFITLKVGDDDYYYMIALLTAYHYHENRTQNGCNASDLIQLAGMFSIGKLVSLGTEKITALMEEMCELNVLQHTGNDRYRFARHSFCQMMGTVRQIDDELMNYMED